MKKDSIETGLRKLNNTLRLINNRICVYRVFHGNQVDFCIFYRTGFFKKSPVGEIKKAGFNIVNPKSIGLTEDDMHYVVKAILNFRNDYL